MIKERGFNILECLLVLVVIAVVSLIGIRRYHTYQRNIQMANIKSDIAMIQSALNRYYHTQDCQLDGHFVGNRTPSLATLGLTLPGRPPQIPLGEAYQVAIIATGEETTDNKPVYALQVSANFASRYSEKRMQWYQKALGAGRVTGRRLFWLTLPGSTASAPGTKLWVLKSQGEQFRRVENKAWKDLKEKTTGTSHTSPSYCAH